MMAAPGEPPAAPPGDVRPTVALPRRGVSGAALAALFVGLGLLLFLALNARRQGATPADQAAGAGAALIQSPPPLVLPPAPPPPPVLAPPAQILVQPAPPAPEPPRPAFVPPAPAPVSEPAALPRAPAARAGEPALVVDATSTDTGAADRSATPPNGPIGILSMGETRVRAAFFRNRATTVPQGTLIPAVLETAFDSSRPGLARAIVSEDTRGFDGSRVLIPRGSRLVGEYRADAVPGQRRATITWTRLIRPDGAAIAIGSPSGDTLGRGGITGTVDTHFLQRFGGAILQSALELGVNVATAKAAAGNVIVGVPGQLAGGAGATFQPQQIPPTIRVRQGTALTIFVARDLDFTAVEGRR